MLRTFKILSETIFGRAPTNDVITTSSGNQLSSARKVWLSLFFCLASIVGFMLSLLGLTGALLVFNGPMLRMEIGQDIFPAGTSHPLHAAVDQWIANAHRTYDDLNRIQFVSGAGYGFAGGTNLIAEATDNKHWVVSINPNSGLPLRRFIWEDTYSTSILKLHSHLATFLSSTSWRRHPAGWIGVPIIIFTAIGLYLWWPRSCDWRNSFIPAHGMRGLRRLLDLHNLAAVYLLIPLFVLAFTGFDLANPSWIEPAVSLVSVARTPDPDALAKTSKPGSCESRTTPGQAVVLAQARFPSTRFVSVTIPENQPYMVQLASSNNIGDKGQTQVFVDRECPAILTVIDGEVGVAAETFKAVMHPLHYYLMLGRVGQVIAFLAGLFLPFSFVTGLLLWRNRRRNLFNAD